MKGKYKVLLSIIIILILIIIAFLVMSKLQKTEQKKKEEPINDVEVKVLESIEKYGYSLDERDSKLTKEVYEELKEILNEEEIDNEKYAKCIAELFVIDLWTMNNKTNKFDVGGTKYVYPDNVANYKLNVENTIYKIIENNVNGSRKQELPAVKSIKNADVSKDKFAIGDKTVDSYVVSLEWDYEADLGYETKAKVTLIEKDSKLYVAEYEAGE